MKQKSKKGKKAKPAYGPNRAYALAVSNWAANKAIQAGNCCAHKEWAWARLVSDTHVKTCTCPACVKVHPERPRPTPRSWDLHTDWLLGAPGQGKSATVARLEKFKEV